MRFADPESAAAQICGKKTALQAASRLKTQNLGVPFTVKQQEKSFPPNFQRAAVALRVPQTSTLRQNEVRPSLTAAHAWREFEFSKFLAGIQISNIFGTGRRLRVHHCPMIKNEFKRGKLTPH